MGRRPRCPRTWRENLLKLICELRSRGMAIVFTTHRLPEAFKVADRFVVLRRRQAGRNDTRQGCAGSSDRRDDGRPADEPALAKGQSRYRRQTRARGQGALRRNREGRQFRRSPGRDSRICRSCGHRPDRCCAPHIRRRPGDFRRNPAGRRAGKHPNAAQGDCPRNWLRAGGTASVTRLFWPIRFAPISLSLGSASSLGMA